ncbi:ABC transporter substrate-binding protein [Paenibacillus aestuarii]|uniref:ABC transporter substrate-binding protein n=1 Tax=Paenibacillus aestuarii TaxID=516965 RepID=A0ABW0K0D2_9BACL|nr:extracellular solute-binding protein [Paenibacillus aestuarii]
MKKWLVLTVSSAIVFSLAACSSDNSARSKSAGGSIAASTGTEKTEIQYWSYARGMADYLTSLVETYNKTNKDNIKVELKFFTENFAQSLDVAFSSSQSPDIYQVNDFTQEQKKGYPLALNDFMKDDFKKRFEPELTEGINMQEGKVYTLPNFGLTQRLIYNVELFEKAGIKGPPKTLNELAEDAKKITAVGKVEGAYGFAVNMKNSDTGLGRSANVITSASGFPKTGYDFKTGKYDFSGHKEAIQAFRQMRQDGSMIPGVESLDIDPLRAQFAEGKIGMYFSNSSEPNVYKSQFPAKIRWAAAPPPTYTGNYDGVVNISLAGTWLAISKDSKHKEQAWKFYEWLAQQDNIKAYQEKGYGISLLPSVLSIVKQPDVKGFEYFTPTQYDAILPPTPSLTVDGKKYNDEFAKYIIDGGDLDKTIADLNNRYNAALEKGIKSGDITMKADPNFDIKKLQGKIYDK